jgi:hypothetical protein
VRTVHAPRLLRSLREGMIVLLDRNFTAQALVTAITATGAQVLGRVKNSRRLPVLRRLGDGPSCRCAARSPSASSTARSRSPPPRAAPPPATASSPGALGDVLGDRTFDDAGSGADAPVGHEVGQDTAADGADEVDDRVGDDAAA